MGKSAVIYEFGINLQAETMLTAKEIAKQIGGQILVSESDVIITNAAKLIAAKVKDNSLAIEDINENVIAENLTTKGFPMMLLRVYDRQVSKTGEKAIPSMPDPYSGPQLSKPFSLFLPLRRTRLPF